MPLLDLLVRLAVVLLAMLVGTGALCLERSAIARTVHSFRSRAIGVLPHLGLLVGILVLNNIIRDMVPTLSGMFDINISGTIYALEGDLVALVQTIQGPALTAYFSFMYIVGYIFLLLFPVIAYFVLEDQRYLKRIGLAFAANYAIGLLFYVIFISYGPRNVIPDLVSQPLYTVYPDVHLLTSAINSNSNVFPSLHASLAITVALLAVRTRHEYPRWVPIALGVAASVVLATVYLGIHWVVDVVAGAVLAVLSVWVARWLQRSQAFATVLS